MRRKYDEKLHKEASSIEVNGKRNEEEVAVPEDVVRVQEEGALHGHSGYTWCGRLCQVYATYEVSHIPMLFIATSESNLEDIPIPQFQ